MASLIARLLRPFPSSSSARTPLTADTASPMTLPDGARRATVAAGCFWGVEHLYRRDFQGKGLLDARVGYMGGDTARPSYRAVCSGQTGHAEACQIVYDPARLSYQTLIEYFYRMHDPTTANRQGPDAGPQYRSAIFCHDDEQRRVADQVTRAAGDQWWHGKIATDVRPAGEWWDAEEYHQLYLHNNPGGYECPSHFVRDLPRLTYDG